MLFKSWNPSGRRRRTASRRGTRRQQFAGAAQIGRTELLETRALLTAQPWFTQVDIDPSTAVDTWIVGMESGQNSEPLSAIGTVTPVGDLLEDAYYVETAGGSYASTFADFSQIQTIDYVYAMVEEQLNARLIPNDPLFPDQWHLQNTGQTGGTVGADANITTVWDNYLGTGVVIGVVDDGFEHTHPDLSTNYQASLSFDFNGNDVDPTPNPLDSHGTSVGGVAAGTGDNNLGISGAAPDADLAGLRLIAGPVTDFTQASALTHENQSIDIYNNSWGPADLGTLAGPGPLALAALRNGATTGRGGLGSIFAWAGGNGQQNQDNVNYDAYANSRYTLAVAAIGHDGVQAPYSEPGAPLIISAYSNNAVVGITTTDNTGDAGANAASLNDGDPLPDPDYTSTFGGTSSATPLVSGVIALMLEANPNLTYRDINHILVNTAEQNDPTDGDWITNGGGHLVNHRYGFGAIDAAAAVAAAESWTLVGAESFASTGVVPVNAAIPDNDLNGVSNTVTVTEDITIEYVEITVNIAHTSRGDLEIVLTSPDGTDSVLAEARTTDSSANYNGWVFTSARHWDESSLGDWTLTVRDRATGSAGSFASYELTFYGVRPAQPIVPARPIMTGPIGLLPSDRPTYTWLPAQDASTYNLRVTDLLTNTEVLRRDGINGLFFADPTPLPDGSYSAMIQGVSAAGVGGLFSEPVVFVVGDPVTPEKPDLLTPTGTQTNSTPTFTWTNVAGAVRYELIVQRTGGNTGTVLRETDLTGTSFTPLAGFSDGTYLARIRAFNALDEAGEFSDAVTFEIDAVSTPAAPFIISPIGIIATSMPTFSWTAVTNGFTYDLWVGRVEADGTLRRVLNPQRLNGTAYTHFSALPNGNYRSWVRAENNQGERSTWSTPENFTINLAPAGRPVVTGPADGADVMPTITWDPVANASRYDLWVNHLTTGTSQFIREQNLTTTSYTPANALPQGVFVAWVRAFNSSDESEGWSAGHRFIIEIEKPGRPTIISPVSGASVSTSRPRIEWVPVSRAVRYEIWMNNETLGINQIIRRDDITSRVFRPDVDLPEGDYRMWVRGINNAGEVGQWSPAHRITLNVPTPDQPVFTGPTLSPIGTVSDTTPTFAWTEIPFSARYDLWVNDTTRGIQQVIRAQNIQGTSFTARTPLPEGDYTAWVSAINGVGERSKWSPPLRFAIRVALPGRPVILDPTGTISDRTPTIVWTVAQGAVEYEIFLRNLSGGAAPAPFRVTNAEVTIDPGTGQVSYELTTPLDPGTYQVWIRALNNVGATGGWSGSRTFQVVSAELPEFARRILDDAESNAVPEPDEPAAEILLASQTIDAVPPEFVPVEETTVPAAPPAKAQPGPADGSAHIPSLGFVMAELAVADWWQNADGLQVADVASPADATGSPDDGQVQPLLGAAFGVPHVVQKLVERRSRRRNRRKTD